LYGLFVFKIQLENSPTMGSIEMTDYERRQLAAQSLESNTRDENFCELFPDLTMVTLIN